MEKNVLESETTIIDNMVVITEKVQTKLGLEQLEDKLINLTKYKEKIQEEQGRLSEECNKINIDIEATKDMLKQLNKTI